MIAPRVAGTEEETLHRSLAPVREALLADARDEAERIVADARRTVERDLADAEQEVEDAVRTARQRGEGAARTRAEQAEGHSRRAAHRRLLAQKEAIRQRFAQATEAAFTGLTDDPRYPALLDALTQRVREQLGDGAEIVRDPSPAGGVVGTAGSLRVDYSLPALARRAAAALDEEVAERCG